MRNDHVHQIADRYDSVQLQKPIVRFFTYSNLWQISLEFQVLIKMYKFAVDLLRSGDVADSSLMVWFSELI